MPRSDKGKECSPNTEDNSPKYDANHIINAEFGYLSRDDVIVALKDICTCPLVLETTNDMIIFNDNCYDKDRFEQLKAHSIAEYERKVSLRYRNPLKILKDPRTNANFNYDIAVSRFCHESVTTVELQRILRRRVPTLSLDDTLEFIPSGNRRHVCVNRFVKHIMSLFEERKNIIELYQAHCKQRERHAGDDDVVQREIRVSRPDLVVAPHPRPLPESSRTVNIPTLTSFHTANLDSPSPSSSGSEDSVSRFVQNHRNNTRNEANEGNSPSGSSVTSSSSQTNAIIAAASARAAAASGVSENNQSSSRTNDRQQADHVLDTYSLIEKT